MAPSTRFFYFDIERLVQVRQEMAAGSWLCPHCYEDDHPHEVNASWKAFLRVPTSPVVQARLTNGTTQGPKKVISVL